MPRKGKEFELAYKWLYELDKSKYKVSSPGWVYDKTIKRKREIDVLIEYQDENGDLRKISVECRDRKSTENAMWIEQLKTKREDLELDFIIAITTNKFTKGAILKARYHGIIIEEAEYINTKIIEKISREFIVDFLFLKFEVQEINFLINNSIKSFKEIFNSINWIYQNELLNFLNKDYYFYIDPHIIMNDNNFDTDSFFKYTENSFITQSNDVVFEDNCPPIIKNLGIKRMYISIKIIPFKSSLPLNKSLSVFEVNPKKNKKYSAFFGSDEEYIQIGYVDDNKVFNKVKLKNRKYYRFVSANMKINTIFPNGLKNNEINMDELIKNGLGEFDLTKVS